MLEKFEGDSRVRTVWALDWVTDLREFIEPHGFAGDLLVGR